MNRTKRATIGQDGEKEAARPRTKAGSKNGWGGRRHGLERGAGKSPKTAVVMTQDDYARLTVTRIALRDCYGKLGSGWERDGSLVRSDGRWSEGEVVRLALRRMWAEMRALGVDVGAGGLEVDASTGPVDLGE